MPQNAIQTADVLRGTRSLDNIGGTVVVKASAGRLARITVNNPGTSGNLVLNDAATVAGATAANQIISLPWNAINMYAGAVVILDWPCANGIVVSGVPGGSPNIAIAYL
jgi:hypothetical protein